MRFAIYTLGCKVNQYETQAMETLLTRRGHQMVPFEDAADVSDWAYEALCWMTMNGIIQGLDDGLLHPKGSATRAQVATMLMRYEALMKK